jgi:hypothetical protein
LLSIGGRSIPLSARHSEILALLGTRPEGLSAEELALALYPGDGSSVTLRAEMVRLRKVLHELDPAAVPESRPYRLPIDLGQDAAQVLSCLQRGAHRIALEIYKGAVLPHSEAPGIVELREKVSALLREAVLNDGSAEALLKYAGLPEAAIRSFGPYRRSEPNERSFLRVEQTPRRCPDHVRTPCRSHSLRGTRPDSARVGNAFDFGHALGFGHHGCRRLGT